MKKLSVAPAPPSMGHLTNEAIQGMYRVGGMISGQISKAAPWAMWLDRDGNYWLHPEYVVHDWTTGLREGYKYQTIRIHRTAAGYRVCKPSDMEYVPVDDPKHVGSTEATYLPVLEVIEEG